METSVWVYPWDLHDLGLEHVVSLLQGQGATMLSVATSYHAGRFLQPSNPKRRVYFPQDGTVYYQLDPCYWQGAEIEPLQADLVAAEGDYLAKALQSGLAVSCWTVFLHNTRLGMKHPDHVSRTAFGDPSFYSLCPSSPAVRDYAVRLVAEISERFGPERIEVETPDWLGFDHGYHHQKDGLGLLPEDEFLLSLCFCKHCLARAAAEGVDGVAAQAQVTSHLEAAFERALPQAQFDYPARGIAAFEAVPEIAAWLAWRSGVVTSLLREMKAACAAPTRLILIDFAGSWSGGLDQDTAYKEVDGVLYCAYQTAAADLAAELQSVRAKLGAEGSLSLGLQLFYPVLSGPEDLTARVAAARPFVTGFNFYNLGLVPKARLKWMQAALAGAPPDREA